MKSTVSLEEVKKIISFPLKGEKWGVKNLIGAALTLGNYIVPLVPVIPVLGYAARIMKRIIVEDEDPALPEWNDWGNLFLDGLKLLGVMVIFELPAILLLFVSYGVLFIPVLMMSASSASNAPPATYFITLMLFDFGGMALMVLGILLLLAMMLFLPPALGNMIAKGNFSAAFRIGEWWPVFKKNFAGYLLALVLIMGLYVVLIYVMQFMVFTIILCLFLPFVMSFIGFWLSMVTMSLFAIAYRDGARKLAEAS